MTETDDKLSFETSKEEPVQETENASLHSAEPFPSDAPSQPKPRKTLMGLGMRLPSADSAAPSTTEPTAEQLVESPRLPRPLRIPALRDKLASAKNKSLKQHEAPKFTLPPPSHPPLEQISEVGYDDAFEDDVLENQSSINEPAVEESIEELPEIPVLENIEELPEIPVLENIEALPEISVQDHIEALPEIPVEEELAFISEIVPLDDDLPAQNDVPTAAVPPAVSDFEDEATQIGAGLYDFPEKHGSIDHGGFDDEHTQISEGLHFEADRKADDSVSQDLEDEHTEIAAFDMLAAQDKPAPQALVSAASAVSSTATSSTATAPSPPEAHDDDFDDDKTELYDSPFENDPICPKLTVLSGPALGMEFFVNKMRNSIGRGTNNTIVVPDPSMSRQHFEINQALDESFVLRDLQAVNGTYLNGTKIVEADLFHGDRIEAGKTVIQFLIGSTAPPVSKNRRIIPASTVVNESLQAAGPNATFSAVPIAAPATTERDPGRIALYVALACACLSIPLLGLIIFVAPPGGDPSAAPIPTRIESGQTASQTYLAGAEAVKRREWPRARALFLQVVELEPSFDGIPAQLTRIDNELSASKLFEEAQADMKLDKTDLALTKARNISQNSVYFDDAQKLIRQIRQREVFTIFDEARAKFDQGDRDQASQLLTELLEIVPEHVEGIELKARIKQLNQEEARRQAAAQRAAAASRKTTASDINTIDWAETADTPKSPATASPPHTQPRAGKPVINFTEGLTYYRARNFTKAIDHFQRIASSTPGAVGQRAEKTVSNIRRFETSYNNGQAAFQKSNWAEAARHFQEAHRADIAVGGASGYFSKEISEKLAHAFGEMGMTAFNARQYQRAFTSLQRGNSHYSQHATLKNLARELNTQSTLLYNQAVQLKSSNPKKAAENCRTILTMVDANSATYKDAKKLLNTL